MKQGEMESKMKMGSPMESMMTGPLGLPRSRDGSGTAWQPDSTPMYALHAMLGNWTLMTHANVFFGYDYQGSDRGDDKAISTNWFMLGLRHALAGGELGARAMLSLEPLTVGDEGYPLLLQTGEAFEGALLHDRQHPHDLFMELVATYERPITDSLAVQIYAAPVGEPALGPVAFPHRLSASSDPLAPLGHHWQDSTHITFGVVTAGVFTRYIKVEASWFNGREPDDERYDFDFRALDSFSARLSLNLIPSVSLQGSYGFLESPEELEPDVSVHRVTASVTYNESVWAKGNWATTLVWGHNHPADGPMTNSALLETNLNFDGHNNVFGRAEYVQKTGVDLALDPADEGRAFDIGSVVLGYLYEFGPFASILPSIGARGSINFVGDQLPVYGTSAPAGWMIFVRVRPAMTTMSQASGAMPH